MNVISTAFAIIIFFCLVASCAGAEEHTEDVMAGVVCEPFGPDQSTLAGRKRYAIEFFLKKGWSLEAAAGVLGNIAVESPDFYPSQKENSGLGEGVHQFTPYKVKGVDVGHPTRYRAWLANQGFYASELGDSPVKGLSPNPWPLNRQLEYFYQTIQFGEVIGTGVAKNIRDELDKAISPEQAAVTLMKLWYRPEVEHEGRRKNEARSIYNRFLYLRKGR